MLSLALAMAACGGSEDLEYRAEPSLGAASAEGSASANGTSPFDVTDGSAPDQAPSGQASAGTDTGSGTGGPDSTNVEVAMAETDENGIPYCD